MKSKEVWYVDDLKEPLAPLICMVNDYLITGPLENPEESREMLQICEEVAVATDYVDCLKNIAKVYQKDSFLKDVLKGSQLTAKAEEIMRVKGRSKAQFDSFQNRISLFSKEGPLQNIDKVKEILIAREDHAIKFGCETDLIGLSEIYAEAGPLLNQSKAQKLAELASKKSA